MKADSGTVRVEVYLGISSAHLPRAFCSRIDLIATEDVSEKQVYAAGFSRETICEKKLVRIKVRALLNPVL